eukprot:1413794-Rhodomonas_salina.4
MASYSVRESGVGNTEGQEFLVLIRGHSCTGLRQRYLVPVLTLTSTAIEDVTVPYRDQTVTRSNRENIIATISTAPQRTTTSTSRLGDQFQRGAPMQCDSFSAIPI